MAGRADPRPVGDRTGTTSSHHLRTAAVDTPTVAEILAQVDRNTDGWWRSCGLAGVRHLAALGEPFTAHDVAALGVPEPDHASRWGGLFLSAYAAGIITSAGIVRSTRPSTHGAWVRQWVGVGAQHAEEAA